MMDTNIRKRTFYEQSPEEICKAWMESYNRLMQEKIHVVKSQRQADGTWVETYNGPIQGQS